MDPKDMLTITLGRYFDHQPLEEGVTLVDVAKEYLSRSDNDNPTLMRIVKKDELPMEHRERALLLACLRKMTNHRWSELFQQAKNYDLEEWVRRDTLGHMTTTKWKVPFKVLGTIIDGFRDDHPEVAEKAFEKIERQYAKLLAAV